MSNLAPVVFDGAPSPGRGARAHRGVAALRQAGASGSYDALAPMLRRLLRNACTVLGASQGFFVVSRSGMAYDIACAHNMRPSEVMDVALHDAAAPLSATLSERLVAAGDLCGETMPVDDGLFDAHSPAVLCVPLELGAQENGAMCLLRLQARQRISDLDLEIIQAVAEQAALALTAARQTRALTRLQASLNSLPAACA
ncbi:MAG TPA: GAF domain-containing protein [Nevskiaceae bacterium]|nr:GAF domain-containing protein [Nevskiaceae bacterium]